MRCMTQTQMLLAAVPSNTLLQQQQQQLMKLRLVTALRPRRNLLPLLQHCTGPCSCRAKCYVPCA